MICQSTAIKFTVQMNLFGGSCQALHNGRHEDLFDKIDNLDVIGCFCLTELGFGNNAVKMETTSTYDKSTGEFIVNSPTDLSQKYWISNGAHHANHALVFGQTIVNGKNEGVNAFLVKIRDENGELREGVKIRDMGIKIGVNGVDNAIVRFNNVRIPRVNMMNKYCDVDETGTFQSRYKTNNIRFFKVTERLLSGRICIAAIALGGTRACLNIAVKYAQQRKSIGPEGLSTVPIFNYQLQQNALLPLFARSLALNVFYNFARDVFANPGELKGELPSICNIVKTMMSWNYSKVATVCRERCGGMGFLSNSRFAEHLACSHTTMTAEGDNRVLMHKIVKDMLKGLKNGYKHPQPSMNVTQQIGTFDDVSGMDTLSDLFRFRQIVLCNRLVAKMGKLAKDKVHPYDIQMYHTSDFIQDLALAYGERRMIDACQVFLSEISGDSKKTMETVFRVFAIDCVKRDLALYVSEGAISQKGAANLLIAQNSLVKGMAEKIEDLVVMLNVPADVLYTPIASDYVTYYSKPNFGEVVGAKL